MGDGLELMVVIVGGAFLIWLVLVVACILWGRWWEHLAGRR